MTNSAYPEQLASSEVKPTDLDLHCLQRQGISGFSRIRVKGKLQSTLLILTLDTMTKFVIKTIRMSLNLRLRGDS